MTIKYQNVTLVLPELTDESAASLQKFIDVLTRIRSFSA